MDGSLLESTWDIPVGAPVYTADGRRLGVVTGGDAAGLVVEDGVFIHHTHAVDLSDVERDEQGALVLKLARQQIEER